MAKQRFTKQRLWFQPVEPRRKSCPHCKAKLEPGESVWSMGYYYNAKWRSDTVFHRFCKSCWPERIKLYDPATNYEGYEFVGRGYTLPDWLTMTPPKVYVFEFPAILTVGVTVPDGVPAEPRAKSVADAICRRTQGTKGMVDGQHRIHIDEAEPRPLPQPAPYIVGLAQSASFAYEYLTQSACISPTRHYEVIDDLFATLEAYEAMHGAVEPNRATVPHLRELLEAAQDMCDVLPVTDSGVDEAVFQGIFDRLVASIRYFRPEYSDPRDEWDTDMDEYSATGAGDQP